MTLPPLAVHRMGIVPYRDALAEQQRVRAQRLAGQGQDTLLLLEHPPVITTTRRHGASHITADPDVLSAHGVEVVQTDRGGDVTAHALGQLVAYPIVRLEGPERDLPRYMRNLEQAVLGVLQAVGLEGIRVVGEPGVFLAPTAEGGKYEKVCAVGVKGTRFVMSHGLALNVSTALEVFGFIVPCGLHHRGVTSLQARLGARTPSMDAVMDLLAPRLATALGRALVAA